jgi:hypothetical protein
MKRTVMAIAAAALVVPAASQAAGAVSAGSSHGAVAQREVRIVGKVTRLTAAKVTVANAARGRTFVIPAGFNLGGVIKGDRVEAEGEREGGKLVLTSIHRENSAVALLAARQGGDDGPGHDRGDDHGHRGGHDG